MKELGDSRWTFELMTDRHDINLAAPVPFRGFHYDPATSRPYPQRWLRPTAWAGKPVRAIEYRDEAVIPATGNGGGKAYDASRDLITKRLRALLEFAGRDDIDRAIPGA